MITLAAVTPIGMIIGIILTIHVDAQSGDKKHSMYDIKNIILSITNS